jgi:glyoxylase-like metal-dependent hydrolase (beta-lactamase superfamily II)
MRVNHDLIIIKTQLSFGGATRDLHLSLIADDYAGTSLVDTGMPGSEAAIENALKEVGLGWQDVKKLLVTHHDIDHVGSLKAVQALTQAPVYAHEIEIPYIQGERPFAKAPTPEQAIENPERAKLLASYQQCKVDHALTAGDHLDIAGGVRLIATPGHTPGHSSYYLERTQTLIAGDALTAADGKLNGPNPGATPDMDLAMQSLEKLLDIDIQTIVCYHGGLVTEDVAGQLRRVVNGG